MSRDSTKYAWMFHQAEEKDEGAQLKKEWFFSNLRAAAYKKNHKSCPDWPVQWAYITGARTKDKDGRKIVLSKRNQNYLDSLFEYYQTSEGLDTLMEVGITPPGDADEILEWISGAKTDREMKRDLFRYFLKNIRRFL